jgi:hypothetical protein
MQIPSLLKLDFRKPIILFLVFSLLVTQLLGFLPHVDGSFWPVPETAYAAETAHAADLGDGEVFDVVVLVVEEDLIEGNHFPGGLIDGEYKQEEYKQELISDDTLSDRIYRFAEDIQKDTPRTVVRMLTYNKANDDLLDVITALENFYKNGDETVNSRLAGAIFIGEVPLPVVNKNGNRFISMFPVSDFDEKYYEFNPLTEAFEVNADVVLPKVEIWHSVLRAPQMDDDPGVSSAELNKLAVFFDKNHLYHLGIEEYSEFDRKLFYGDLIDEDKRLNETTYGLYQNFLENMDDLTYKRFNKHWAKDLTGKVAEDLEDAFNATQNADIDPEFVDLEKDESFKDPDTGLAPDEQLLAAVQGVGNTDPMDKMPDMHTKGIIEKFHVPYTEIVFKAIAQSNDFANFTARYAVEHGGMNSVPALISMKDELAKQYFRSVNDAIERRVNELVSVISTAYPLVRSTEVKGTIGEEPFVAKFGLSLMSGGKLSDPPFGENIKYTTFDNALLDKSFEFINHYQDEGKMYINGVSEDLITSPKQCFPYLGTMYDPTSDDYSVLTRSIRSDNPMTGKSVYGLGVNGLGLPASEALKATDDNFDYGMVVDDNLDYGYPAFYNDSPLEGFIDKGDVLLAVEEVTYVIDSMSNIPPSIGYKISEDKNFAIPIEDLGFTSFPGNGVSFNTNAPLVECTPCSDYKENLESEPPVNGVDYDYKVEVENDGELSPVLIEAFPKGFFEIDDKYYYLSAQHDLDRKDLIDNLTSLEAFVEEFYETVGPEDKGGMDEDKIYYNDKSYFTVRYYDTSAKQVSTTGPIYYNDLVPIFSLEKDDDHQHAYGIDHDSGSSSDLNWLNGCFMSSTLMHDDRCFALTARYPVLDPAGSFEPFSYGNSGVLTEKTGEDEEGYSYDTTYDESDTESVAANDYVYKHEFPIGNDVIEYDDTNPPGVYDVAEYDIHKSMFDLPDGRTFDDVDEIYYDGCYYMLQNTSDTGAYTPDNGGPPIKKGIDWYSEVTGMMLGFSAYTGHKNKHVPYGGSGRNVPLIDSVEKFVLNEDTDLTLATFAKYYGLYDGIDNDEDGNIDFEKNEADLLELDMDEADIKYSLDPNNVYMVSRALLGPRFGKWNNPDLFYNQDFYDEGPMPEGANEPAEYWYPLLSDLTDDMTDLSGSGEFDPEEDIILKVKPDIAKYISSLIVHNEPTAFTISSQIDAGITMSLPIDDPRYVAFLDRNGDVQKLEYPNLFDETIINSGGANSGISQFGANVNLFALDFLKVPGSDKVTAGNVTKYVTDSILEVTTQSEKEESETENYVKTTLVSADADVLRDSLEWISLSIDDKHEYILKHYLNDDLQAYIRDDNGYEAAYLVFDGGSRAEGDYFDMGFNRAIEEEENESFNEVIADYDEKFDENGYPLPSDNDDDKEWFEYFFLLEWFVREFVPKMDEIVDFAVHFSDNITLQPICGESCETNGCDQILTTLEITPNKDSAYADGTDSIEITVTGYDEAGALYTKGEYPSLEIFVSQDDLNAPFKLEPADLEKTLREDGTALYKLNTTDDVGSAVISVIARFSKKSELEDVVSNQVQIDTSERKLNIVADTLALTAGDEAEIEVTAQLMDDNGLNQEANNEVTFTVSGDEGDLLEFVDGNVVNAENGLATVLIKSKTDVGLFDIHAKVTDGVHYAVGEKEFAVVPNVPAKIKIISDTDTLVANNESMAHVRLELHDAYDNLAYNAFAKVALFVFGNARLDNSADLDAIIPGLQMIFKDGIVNTTLYSRDKIGEANLYAVLLDHALNDEIVEAKMNDEPIDFFGVIGASKNFTILSDLKLQLIAKDVQIDADGSSNTRVSAQLSKMNGDVISGFDGDISFTVSDPMLGYFSEDVPLKMENGVAGADVFATTKTGDLTIEANVPGFAKNSIDVTTLPGPAVKIELLSEDDIILTDSTAGTKLKARLLDQYDNLAYSSQAIINFDTTSATSSLVDFKGPNVKPTIKGEAQITINSTGLSGFANLMASFSSLEKGTLTLSIKKRISEKADFDEMSPKALYINLLGGAYGDLGKNDLASSLIFNGESQVLVTTTAEIDDFKRLIFVDGYGQIETIDQNVSSYLYFGNDSSPHNTVKFVDEIKGEEVGEMFVVLEDDLDLILVEEGKDFKDYNEGVLVQALSTDSSDPTFKMTEDEDKVLIMSGDVVSASVDNEGIVNVIDSDFEIDIPGETDEVDKSYFSFVVKWKGKTLGQIMFKQDFEAGIVTIASDNEFEDFLPGIYIRLQDDDAHFGLASAFSRYSTDFIPGKYFVDRDEPLDSSMAPGLNYTSLENAYDSPGVGFKGGNKNMLLFAAGNTAGEANLPYAAEAGILMGDPTVRVDNTEDDLVGDLSGFTQDIGQLVYTSSETIQEIITFEYNGDDREDLLIVQNDGKIRLLQNELSNKKFRDRGVMLDIVNGVLSLAKIDINNDGVDDLIIGSKDSCLKDEQCLYLYENDNGQFVRNNLALNTASKVYEMHTADLNADNYPDLVLSDSSGNVYVFWNENGQIDSIGDHLGNFSVTMNGIDLIDDVLLSYGSLPSDQSKYFVNMNVKEKEYDYFIQSTEIYVRPGYNGPIPDPPKANQYGIKEYKKWYFDDYDQNDLPETYSKVFDFLLPKYDDRFKVGSSKTAIDLNGAPVGLGDIIEHKIVLKNSSGSSVSDLKISLLASSGQDFDEDSLDCLEASCDGDDLYWEDTSLVHRPKTISGLSIPANSTRTITYLATVKETPKVTLALGAFEESAVPGDGHDVYFDILVRPDSPQIEEATYFYSKNNLDAGGRVEYVKYDPEPVGSDVEIPLFEDLAGVTADDKATIVAEMDAAKAANSDTGDCDEDAEDDEACGNADSASETGGVEGGSWKEDVKDEMKEMWGMLNQDVDFDGMPDSWDDVGGFVQDSLNAGIQFAENLANMVADKLEGALKAFKCSGAGCLPVPINWAFLVPSDPFTGAGGISIFSWGTPSPIGVSFFAPSITPSSGRLYLSPTLTMGVGIAVCTGPMQAAACYAFSLPMRAMLGDLCTFLEDKIQEALNWAAEMVAKAVDKIEEGVKAATIGMVSTSSGGKKDTNVGNGNYGSGSDPLQFDLDYNISIPGFPSVFTNWMDAQIKEVFNKLLDGPDFYLVLPDFTSLYKDSIAAFKQFGNISSIQHLKDIIKYISQIPLIQIKGKEVKLKIPVLQKEQIEKYKYQWQTLVKNLKTQAEKIKKTWTCDKSAEHETICDKVKGDINNMISSIQQNLDAIESYRNLPKDLLQWRTVQQKYAKQIICYMDAIMDLVGGYIKKQGRIIGDWIRAITKIVEAVKSWKALVKLILEYQQSCDKCMTERHGMLGLILQLLVVIPSPPVIPLPKWPNFVFDLSQIEMGVEILWPDIAFVHEPIILPDLPTINLPDEVPEIAIKIPAIPVIPTFDFGFDLPDLPPLKMPVLPDLPEPFKVPSLPKPIVQLTAVIKAILKVLCLLKQGFLPIPEVTMAPIPAANLKTQIETMTNPPVTPVFPISLALSMNWPEIQYEAPVEVKFELQQKYGVNTSAIYWAVEKAATWWNDKITLYIGKINGYLQGIGDKISEYADIEKQLEDALKEQGIEIPTKLELDLEDGNVDVNVEFDGESSDYIRLLAYDKDFDLEASEYSKYDVDLGEMRRLAVDQYEDPYLRELASLRNSIFDYASEMSNTDQVLSEIDDYESFVRILVEEDEILDEKMSWVADSSFSADVEPISMRQAQQDFRRVSSPAKLFDIDVEGYEQDFEKMFVALNANDLVDPSEGATGDGFGEGIGAESLTDGLEQIPTDGITVAVGNQSEEILAYTEEINESTQIMFIDVDYDGDDDAVYSLGGDLYLKENYNESPDEPSEFGGLKQASKISDYSDGMTLSVQGFSSDYENSGVAKVSFKPSKDPSVVGYEVLIYPSLIDIEEDDYNGTYHFLAVENLNVTFGNVDDVDGLGNELTTASKEIIDALAEIKANEGDTFYAVDDSGFAVYSSLNLLVQEVELDEGEFYTIPEQDRGSNVTVQLISGALQKMSPYGDEIVEPLLPGVAFMEGDKLVTDNNGGADIIFNNGAEVVVNENEIFEMLEYADPDSPKLSLNIDNGNYYAVVYALSDNGSRSMISETLPLSPSVCADDSAPLPALSTDYIEVAVMQKASIDASASIDPSGDIEGYYLDLDVSVDADNDGNLRNDKDYKADTNLSEDGPDLDNDPTNDLDLSVFELGPYEEVGNHYYALNIYDTGHNLSTKDVTVHVYVPKINLNTVYAEILSPATGDTDPSTGNMFYKLIRERYVPRVIDEKLTMVKDTSPIETSAADDNGQYLTYNDGTYSVSDFNLENIILVKNAAGEVIAEIDGDTGNFYVYEGTSYVIKSAIPPDQSTHVEILDDDGNVVATIYYISEGNYEVTVHEEIEFTSESVEDMMGVNVNDVNTSDQFVFKQFPASDPNYPGGTYLYYLNEEKQMVAIDTAGNILLLDDRMSLTKLENQFNYDPIIFELWFDEAKVAQVYLSTGDRFEEVQIVGPNDVPRKFPNSVSPSYLVEETAAVFGDPFEGTGGTLHDYAMSLFYKGIIDDDGDLGDLSTRADFAEVLLKILCIVPREEAYDEPSVFSDIDFVAGDLASYYPFVKEGALLGLVYGYGEEADAASGLTPFKPQNPIAFAEAVAMILRGLDLKHIINMEGVAPEVGEAWYDPLLEVAQNLNSYVESGVDLQSASFVTEDELADPGKLLTKGDLIELAFRVLDAYDCHEVDADKDGMADYCEEKYGIDDPEADVDNDNLKNSDECLYGTDPNNPDSDNGGQLDGDEVWSHGTDPNFTDDDHKDTDGDGLLDIEETVVYGTDPNVYDTDGGGVGDGDEVELQIDPLNGDDDQPNPPGQLYETEPGVYLVPPPCVACPCFSTFEYKADLRKGDVLYTIIVNNDPDNLKIYAKSNEQKVQ